MLRSLVERAGAPTTSSARRAALVADHPDVIAAIARADRGPGAAARRRRAPRAACAPTPRPLDLRLLFAATRAAKRLEPEQWRRMLELMIDALDTHRGADP